jgi:hypothetical protein
MTYEVVYLYPARPTIERLDGQRHLSAHFGHITHLSSADRQSLAAGTTEIMHTPSGTDLAGEAERFYQAIAPLCDH